MNLAELDKFLVSKRSYANYKKDYSLSIEISKMIIEARIAKGITQGELATLVGTAQSNISRIESGRNLPSLSFLEKIASALNTHLIAPRFAFLQKESSSVSNFVNQWKDFSETILALGSTAEVPHSLSSLNFSVNSENQRVPLHW